jgi:glycerophosphoryl diester phosphodiesterase
LSTFPHLPVPTLAIPRLIAHRGASADAPENTLAALREAARQGAGWVEVDAVLTADGVPVVIHDDTLDRTTDGHGPVAAAEFAALRRRDAGSWFAPRFAGERVPTLAETIDLALELGLGLNVEIKPAAGHEEATARAVAALVDARWPVDRPLVLLSSFEPVCLDIARAVVPRCPRGYLLWDPPADWLTIARRVDAATINVHQDRQTAASIAAHAVAGRPVLAYTVNDPGRARTLFGWGVAGVFTDAPGRMAAGLDGP